MDPMKCFANPDDICQMEYRAIYEHMKETLDDCPQPERLDLALGMLKEFEGWAKAMRSTLKRSSKKPRGKGIP